MSAIQAIQQGVQDVVRQVDFGQPQVLELPGRPKESRVHPKLSQESVKQQDIAPEEIEKRTEQLNQVMEIFNYNIRFSVDREAKRLVVKIVDPQTEEVIRQIPPEEMLQIMKRIDQMLGLILDERV
jgi:flagellar protein FlaG